MKIKNFKARSFSEALKLVKKEMGDDAVILSSRERKGYVEVAAAVDFAQVESAGASRQAAEARAAVAAGRPAGRQAERPRDAREFLSIKRELQGLRAAIRDIKSRGLELSVTGEQRDLYEYLRDLNVNRALATELCDRITDISELKKVISSGMKTLSGGYGRKAVIVIGPTGVGKTTTIAKLAARAVKEGKKVALVNLDTYRIGAVEQIRIYSRILGVPLDVVSSAEELRQSLVKYAEKDAIFIDTTGRNPREKSYIEELRAAGGLGFSLETHLLMSASSDDLFMTEAYKYYRHLPIDCIAFSKVDEAVRLGSIYNLARLYRKPIAYIATGQRVPQDIAFPDSGELAARILKISGAEAPREAALCGAA